MDRATILALLLCVAPLAGTPGALAACAGAGPAGGCADAAADGSSNAFVCVATPAAMGCATAFSRSGNGTFEDGRVCTAGSAAPVACQGLRSSDVVATVMGVPPLVLKTVGDTIRTLDEWLPCEGVPPRHCIL